tara:strand:- start:467 stop:739 length:273 start_codon:yes stop_codon:yes gene_type:complete
MTDGYEHEKINPAIESLEDYDALVREYEPESMVWEFKDSWCFVDGKVKQLKKKRIVYIREDIHEAAIARAKEEPLPMPTPGKFSLRQSRP